MRDLAVVAVTVLWLVAFACLPTGSVADHQREMRDAVTRVVGR